MKYVAVVIAKQHGGAKHYTYQTTELLAPGALVRVPFGKKLVVGIVVAVVKKPSFATKDIVAIIPYALPKTSVELLAWLCEFYPDDYGSLAQLLLPSSFTKRESTALKPKIGKNDKLPKANPEQTAALQTIKKATRTLLHGDTGTGKTRVFLEIAQATLAAGKSVVIVTPEIGLTPQLLTDISRYLPAPILTTHSALSEAKRRKVWEYAATESTPSVYIGPRSALFLPFKNLGLIVVDEAHDAAYKQTQSPRYQALHVAAKIASLSNAKIILSTATPNIADKEQLQSMGYRVARLTQLAAGEHRSMVSLVDITDRDNFTRNQYLSDELVVELADTLAKNEQAMIFLNRRGSARLVQCAACGWQALCPTCGIPLTYHHDLHTIRCHTCNYTSQAPSSCPTCGSVDLQFKSIGTKALVDQLHSLFSNAAIMRFDTDNLASEQLHHHVDTIKAGDVDIVVGTQLITKGIDLPNLGLVGVVNADTGLNLPDFRAEELSFQQLHQVIGRVDRGHRAGRAIVQTRVPEHPVMQAVLNRSWDDFAAYELHKRKMFGYPPYRFIAQFQVIKKTSASAEKESVKMFDKLQASGLKLELLGPSPSFYEQTPTGAAWQIVAKSPKRSELVAAAKLLGPDWRADIDPTNLL